MVFYAIIIAALLLIVVLLKRELVRVETAIEAIDDLLSNVDGAPVDIPDADEQYMALVVKRSFIDSIQEANIDER